MSTPPEHADTLSQSALRSLVSGLLERSQQAEGRLEKLEAGNIQLGEENAALWLKNTRLKVENQLLRDEIARIKNLPPRPPFRPSGMEKANGACRNGQSRRRSLLRLPCRPWRAYHLDIRPVVAGYRHA